MPLMRYRFIVVCCGLLLSACSNTQTPLLTAEEALTLVQSQPAVQRWLSQFPNGLNTTSTVEPVGAVEPVIEVDSQTPAAYRIHVYEIVNDTHTATMGWYTVDKKTGSITEELGSTDTTPADSVIISYRQFS